MPQPGQCKCSDRVHGRTERKKKTLERRDLLQSFSSLIREFSTALFPKMFPSFGCRLCNSLKNLEPTNGLEPLTCRLRIGCSTN
jgi:hypothetical protein